MHEKANRIRSTIIKMAHDAKEGHLQGALSCADILLALYNGGMNEGDKLYFSKGHAAAALYAVWADKGIIPIEELKTYCKPGSMLASHPSKASLPLLEISSGSLGMGLGVASGAAYGLKMKESNARCFVIMGDGECNEGSVWEAVMFAKAQRLNNLIAIVDNNNQQSVGRHTHINGNVSLARKFKGFGWCVKEINGHSFYQLGKALEENSFSKCSPTAIICKTIGGKGIPFMENNILWHYRVPSDEDLEDSKKILGEPLYA